MRAKRALIALFVFCAACLWGGMVVAQSTHPSIKSQQPVAHYAMGLDFDIPESADVYLVSQKPFTLLYRQWMSDIKGGVVLGEALVTFKDGTLQVTGLGLQSGKADAFDRRQHALNQNVFLRTLDFRGKTAVDLFPFYHSFGLAGKVVLWTGMGVQLHGQEKLPGLVVEENGENSSIKIYQGMGIGKPQGAMLGKVDYACRLPSTPWFFTADLNADGNSEILVGQPMYRHKELFILTTTPAEFDPAVRITQTLGNMSGNWPQRGSAIFKKGNLDIIPTDIKESGSPSGK